MVPFPQFTATLSSEVCERALAISETPKTVRPTETHWHHLIINFIVNKKIFDQNTQQATM